ncbi:hypothetical protein [Marinobacter sp. 2_MG-2023]|uniref:hypothetical protein n=1 Tax=Marinobacter sp. 2_MG-2023 TaxID=3062679 RepID=UPI0026E3AEF4|nr:hypothetical protein [Marinobacter sp. 2_MG-2023]MDO6441708.1 hypothetical protein [Marinobacter sp. 2_MG-2023]
MTEHERAYKDELSRALEKCQFIEETLKGCLLSAIEIARIQVSQHFPIKYKSSDISKLPLGPLVKAFEKINEDSLLHQQLREITKERNKVAHQSLLFTIGELENETQMADATLEMKRIADRATEIHHQVLDVRYQFIRAVNAVKRNQSKEN